MTSPGAALLPPPTSRAKLIEIGDLVKTFPVRSEVLHRQIGEVRAVSHVDLDIYRGEALGLVGESGCGKSTLGRCLLRLIEPDSGTVRFDGRDVLALDTAELREWRRDVQIIFQDPFSSLDPRTTVGESIAEGLRVHGVEKSERQERVLEALDMVGLEAYHARRFPHEFSGGQRQRIGIARALAVKPKFLVCDEPVSALDVSIQSQILNLLKDLQGRLDLTLLFVAHNLAVVEHLCDRVAVMYLGRVVEVASRQRLFEHPQHPYTEALLSAIPIPDPTRRPARMLLPGEIPSPLRPPPGCLFHPRCPIAKLGLCDLEVPELRPAADDAGQVAACHLRTGARMG